jgi:ferredoxin
MGELNRTWSAQWPNMTRKGTPPEDADAWKGVPDKAKLFSAEPASD